MHSPSNPGLAGSGRSLCKWICISARAASGSPAAIASKIRWWSPSMCQLAVDTRSTSRS